MKIWISLFVVLFFAGIVRAQVPQEYPNVPIENPAYADVKTWFGEDTSFYCSYGDTVQNPRRMTRYEFAVAVARAIVSPFRSGKQKQGKPDYEIWFPNSMQGKTTQELAALARLVAEFKLEIQQLGISDEQIQFAQSELDFRIKLDSVVPLDNPAYADMYFLIDSGTDGICFYGGTQLWSRGVSRISFAAAIAGYCGLRNEANYQAVILSALSFKNPQELAAVARLFTQFKPELKELGIAEEQIQFAQNELNAHTGSTPNPKPPIAAPFRDVPKTHWAFDAVERLRQSGIVIGISDTAFTQ